MVMLRLYLDIYISCVEENGTAYRSCGSIHWTDINRFPVGALDKFRVPISVVLDIQQNQALVSELERNRVHGLRGYAGSL